MRIFSLYSSQLIILAVIVGFIGFLFFSESRATPGDNDKVIGGGLIALAALGIGFVVYANATDPFIR